MADLQKMPGGADLLKKQEAKQKKKERGSVSNVMSSVTNFQKLWKANTYMYWSLFDLCIASSAVWRRAQEDSRAGVSQTDSLYGRSWVSVDA